MALYQNMMLLSRPIITGIYDAVGSSGGSSARIDFAKPMFDNHYANLSEL